MKAIIEKRVEVLRNKEMSIVSPSVPEYMGINHEVTTYYFLAIPIYRVEKKLI